MKKLITKTLLIAFLCSVVMPNAMQAAIPNAMQAEMPNAMQANPIVDWGRSVMSRLSNHPAAASYGKPVAMTVGAMAVICGAIKIDRWYRSKPKYDYKKLYNTILAKLEDIPERSIQMSKNRMREIFESDEVQKHMPKWSIPMTGTKFILPLQRIRFIEGFVKYCEEEQRDWFKDNAVSTTPTPTPTSSNQDRPFYALKDFEEFRKKENEKTKKATERFQKLAIVRDIAIEYREYLRKSWGTKKCVATFGLGVAVTGVALKLVGKL